MKAIKFQEMPENYTKCLINVSRKARKWARNMSRKSITKKEKYYLVSVKGVWELARFRGGKKFEASAES